MTDRPPTQPPGSVPLRRRPRWAWLRLFRPLALTLGVATALGFVFILQPHPAWHEALRVALVMGGLLAAASALNDAVDAPFDHNVHVWRPIPAGFVTVQNAQRAALAFALLALVLSATLDWRTFLLVLATAVSAYLYSARLKPGPWSWAAWSLAFALVPLWIAEAVNAFDTVLWWSFPVGLTVGLATYMVVKLPDYERDDDPAARNLLHWLTIDYAVPFTWGAVGAAIAVAVGSTNIENVRIEWIVPAGVTALVATLATMGWLFLGVTEHRLIWQRRILVIALLGLTVGWLGSIAP